MSKLDTRIDAVDEEEFEHDLVVMNTRTLGIGTFNGTARVIWDALADGASLGDLVALFREARPDADPDALERDVAALLARLDEAELAVVAGDGG